MRIPQAFAEARGIRRRSASLSAFRNEERSLVKGSLMRLNCRQGNLYFFAFSAGSLTPMERMT